MKTNLQNVRFIIFAIAAVLAIQPVLAQTTNSIVITEDSSTSLTATYSNGSVTVLSHPPDFWQLVFPQSVVFNANAASAWIEPENPSLANAVNSPHFDTLNVFSDIGSTLPPVMDEGTIANVGTDSQNGGTISLTFDDDAATAEVPDTGSTLALLFLSLTVLFGANRLRSIRLA